MALKHGHSTDLCPPVLNDDPGGSHSPTPNPGYKVGGPLIVSVEFYLFRDALLAYKNAESDRKDPL